MLRLRVRGLVTVFFLFFSDSFAKINVLSILPKKNDNSGCSFLSLNQTEIIKYFQKNKERNSVFFCKNCLEQRIVLTYEQSDLDDEKKQILTDFSLHSCPIFIAPSIFHSLQSDNLVWLKKNLRYCCAENRFFSHRMGFVTKILEKRQPMNPEFKFIGLEKLQTHLKNLKGQKTPQITEKDRFAVLDL